MPEFKKLHTEIDPAHYRMALEQAVATFPELIDEILALFGDENAIGEPAALFDYLFVITDRKATGTDHYVFGFRLRNADERLLARKTIEAKKLVERVHG